MPPPPVPLFVVGCTGAKSCWQSLRKKPYSPLMAPFAESGFHGPFCRSAAPSRLKCVLKAILPWHYGGPSLSPYDGFPAAPHYSFTATPRSNLPPLGADSHARASRFPRLKPDALPLSLSAIFQLQALAQLRSFMAAGFAGGPDWSVPIFALHKRVKLPFLTTKRRREFRGAGACCLFCRRPSCAIFVILPHEEYFCTCQKQSARAAPGATAVPL